MTLNSVHAARDSVASDAFNCAELPKRLAHSGPEKDSAYVLGDRLALMVVSRFAGTHYCRRVDGFNLWPEWKASIGNDQRVGVPDTAEKRVNRGIKNACLQHATPTQV